MNLLGQLDDAVTALRRGIQLDGQRVEGYYNLGLVCWGRKGQNDMALTAYREALRLNPRMADAHLNMGNLYMEKDQPRMALQHYEQAHQIRPNWEKALDGIASACQATPRPSRHRLRWPMRAACSRFEPLLRGAAAWIERSIR